MAATFEHLFHDEASGEAIEGAAASWASTTNEDESAAFEAALVGCDVCCGAYYEQKAALSSELYKIANEKDARRLRSAFDLVAAEPPALAQKDLRKSFTTYAHEILQCPDYLADPLLDEAFAAALVACQRVKLLKFKSALLPGLILLAAHNNEYVRNWALHSMAQMDPSLYTDRQHYDSIHIAVGILVNRLTLNDASCKYNLAADSIHIWHCFAATLLCFASDGITALLTHYPSLDTFVCNALLDSSDGDSEVNSPFQYILACFAKFRESIPQIPNQSISLITQLWTRIIGSTWYQTITQTTPWLQDAASATNHQTLTLSDTWNTAFSWIPPLLACIYKLSPSSLEPQITSLLLGLKSYSLHATPEFVRTALLPLLPDLRTYSLTKPTIDSICTLSLTHTSSDTSTDMVLTHFVMECLDSDVDTLEQAFQDIYRDCSGFDEAAPRASLIHSSVWKFIATVGANEGGSGVGVIGRHVLKLFGRIFLLDHVSFVDEAWSTRQKGYVGAFNKGLSMVWFVVHSLLMIASAVEESGQNSNGSSGMDVDVDCVVKRENGNGGVSMADMMYCLVCRSDDISTLAKATLMKMAKVDKYQAMIEWLLQNDERQKIDKLLTILDTFRDLCSMPNGPPLLGCAERIQVLVKNTNHVVFTSEETSYRFTETHPDLWIKSWPFISSILASSIKWAKQDQTIKKDIKLIIAQTFDIVKQLLKHCNVLTSKHLISSATVPFMATVWSIFQWYRVMDDGIREEAVDVTILVLKAAEGFKYVLDDSLIGAVMQYCEGSLKSRLTDANKQKLEGWVVAMYERLEAKKPKKAAESVATVQPSVAAGVRRKASDAGVGAPPSKMPKVEATTFNDPMQRIKALPLAPKPPGRTLEPLSKLSQLRQTHIAEQRRYVQDAQKSRTIATILARADSSDNESDFKQTFKSIKMIDDSGAAVDVDQHKKDLAAKKAAGPVERKKIVTRLRNMNEFFKIFLKWRVDDRGSVPAGFPFELVPIPDRFESNDDYMNVFEPLLVLECWEQFKTSVEETDFSKNFTWTLDQTMMLDEFHDITFVQPQEESKKRITESDLVFIQQSSGKTSERKGFLGKVQKMFTRKGETTYITRVHLKNQHTVVPMLFENSKWSVTKLFSMTTVMREYESLLQLPKVALCSEVIQPLYRKKFQPKEGSVEKAMEIFGANRPQAEAIATATQRPSGFVLIQGPPGTGKTKTILSLVGSLLTSAATAINAPGGGSAIKAPGGGSAIKAPGGGSAIRAPGGGSAIRPPAGGRPGAPAVQASRNVQPSSVTKKNRLLICAPSNAACDEIVRRLKAGILNAQGKTFHPKIVRLGTSDSIGVDIRDLTIENLIKDQLAVDPEFRKINQDMTDNSQWIALEKHQAELNKEREALREKEQKQSNSLKEAELVRNAIAKVSEKLKGVDEKFKALKQKRLEREGSSDHIRTRVKASILLDADVIMATLSGAGHEIVSTLQNFEFPTVIIDEACQSVELSSLIPLRYGAKKCILVGDPMQLPPTVLSPTAKKFGYENSLFQRIMGMHGDSVCLLSIQYRMHPHISVFPSRQFYNSRLLDAEKMDTKCVAQWHSNEDYPTYRFLNVGWGRELRERHSLYNPDEIIACVNFVAKLCQTFPNINFASRIGVITPYRMQMLKMKDKFKEKFGDSILDFVDINTIDAFQGREKDIIILSTVRAGLGEAVGFLRDKRRMNVALTRAKNSLFILGRGISLCNNEDWRALVEDSQARSMFVEMDRKAFGPTAKFDYSSVKNLRE